MNGSSVNAQLGEPSPLPRIDVLIPTLNAAGVLPACLASIESQNYPAHLIRVIIADGKSTDETRAIASAAGCMILHNPLKTGEAGKAVALRAATAEFVAFIDSDNILPTSDWFRRMLEPFSDADIIGAEPIRFEYRREDGFISRYCALLGMNDPLCLFLGNYDRECVLTGKWTDLPIREEMRNSYRKVWLTHERLPTIGANGTIIRRALITPVQHEQYFFDIDVFARLSSEKPICFAKVDIGIVHLYSGSDPRLFLQKQQRRVSDFSFYRAQGLRYYPWLTLYWTGYMRFGIACLTVIPLFWQSWKGYRKKPDPAWWFHPIACLITFGVYGVGLIRGLIISPTPFRRTTWSQVRVRPLGKKL